MTQNALTKQTERPRSLYLLLLLLIAIVAAGYLVFRAFVTNVMPDLATYNLYALAVIAGIASFFSPCAFPLLPSYLSFYHLARPPKDFESSRTERALVLGGAVALGVVTFNLLLGTLIGILGAGFTAGLSISSASPNEFLLIFRGVLGVTLAGLGLIQLAGWSYKPAFVDEFIFRLRPPRDGVTVHSERWLLLYGFGYTAAGIGCTGPVLAGLTIFALGGGGFVAAFSAFGIFALTMGALMVLVSSLVEASQETLIRKLKVSAGPIKNGASLLLILVGLFHVVATFNVSWFVQLLFPK